MKRLYAIAASLLAAFVLCACAAGTPQTDRLLAMSANPAPGERSLPVRAELEEVPFFAQEDFYCGPAALAMILAWSGEDTDQHEIARQIYTPGRQGTLRTDILGGARRNGRLAIPIHTLEDMFREIDTGHPVIVFQNLGLETYPVWHYAVAVGYDLDEEVVILRSGKNRRHLTRLTTFERTWARGDYWALAVLPPDTLPATAGEPVVLEAAAGLERAGQRDAARIAYTTIAERWPETAGSWIGLGNLRYAEGDLAGAEAAFRRATVIAPGQGTGWNNLAVVLGELGRRTEAVRAAETAVSTGEGDMEEFRRTLQEVRGPSA